MGIQGIVIAVIVVVNIAAYTLALVVDDISIKQFLRSYLWFLLVPWLIAAITYRPSKKPLLRTKDDEIKRENRKKQAMEEIKKMRENRLQKEWNNYYRRAPFSFVNKMSDAKFIDLLVRLLKENNYYDVRKTQDEEDDYEGIDILCQDSRGNLTGIEVQKSSSDIGPQAVEQLIKSMNQYGCSKGIIAAISEFTFSAIKLAKTDPRIKLWNGKFIEMLYYESIPAEIPPFSMEKARQLGLPYKIRLSKMEKEILFRKYGLDYDEDFGAFELENL